jgi:hypothetical protein
MGDTVADKSHTMSGIATGETQTDVEETRTDSLSPPQLGGRCKVDRRVLSGNTGMSELCSTLTPG